MQIQKCTQRGSQLLITKILLGVTTAISLQTVMTDVTLATDSIKDDVNLSVNNEHSAIPVDAHSDDDTPIERTIVVGQNGSKKLTHNPRGYLGDDQVVSELTTGDVLRVIPDTYLGPYWNGAWVRVKDSKGQLGWYKAPLPSDNITVAAESQLLNRTSEEITEKFPLVCKLLPGDKLSATPGDNYRGTSCITGWRRVKKEDGIGRSIGWYHLTPDEHYKDYESIKQLIGDVWTPDEQLKIAIRFGVIDKIKDLISKGVDINKTDLSQVIRNGKAEVAELLFTVGAFDTQAMLQREVNSYYPSVKVINFCIEHGANINAKDESKDTILIQLLKGLPTMVEPEQLSAVGYLVANKANPFIKDGHGLTTWDCIEVEPPTWYSPTVRNREVESVTALRSILPSPIFQAVYDGDVDKVIKIIAEDPTAAKQLWRGHSLRDFVQRRIKGLSSLQETDVLQEETRPMARLQKSQVNPELMYRLDQIADILGAFEHSPYSHSLSPDQQKRLAQHKDLIPGVTQGTENILKAMGTPSA